MEVRNFINGKFIDSISNKNIEVTNPANQELVGCIDQALDEEIDLAFSSAKKAFDERILVDMDAKQKSKMMRGIASKLREYKDDGGALLSKENGKTIKQCVDEFKGAADTFDYYAGMTDKIENKLIPSGKDSFNYVVLEPFGVSLQIVPWNYPVSFFLKKCSKLDSWKYYCN
jgi:NAD-dependent aldehyde dehydrogenases